MNRLKNLNDNESKDDRISIGSQGVYARREDGAVVVCNQEAVELFRFNAQACPFLEQPIRFLVEIYIIGYHKGKLIGRESIKSRIYELLGPEL